MGFGNGCFACRQHMKPHCCEQPAARSEVSFVLERPAYPLYNLHCFAQATVVQPQTARAIRHAHCAKLSSFGQPLYEAQGAQQDRSNTRTMQAGQQLKQPCILLDGVLTVPNSPPMASPCMGCRMASTTNTMQTPGRSARPEVWLKRPRALAALSVAVSRLCAHHAKLSSFERPRGPPYNLHFLLKPL